MSNDLESTIQLRDISPETQSSAPILLSRAFSNDPLFLTLFMGHNRDKNMQRFFQYMFKKSVVLKEEIHSLTAQNNLAGVATLECPESLRGFNLLTSPTFLYETLKLAFALPQKSFQLLNTYMKETSSVRPKAPHHYLIFIGIAPEHQGQGYGKALLEAIHQKVDRHPNSIGIGLDTENPHNVPLYEHFGYKLISEKKLGDLTLYCLFRNKKSLP